MTSKKMRSQEGVASPPGTAAEFAGRESTANFTPSVGKRQVAVELSCIVAARARGWSITQIAFAAGVTRQAIQHRLWKYERRQGSISVVRERSSAKRRSGRQTSPKAAWRCLHCRKPQWRSTTNTNLFCSVRCRGLFERGISDSDIDRIITLRRTDHLTWTAITRKLGCKHYQWLQTRIWIALYERDALTRSTVDAIWTTPSLANGRPWAWNWLERATGIACTEKGARRMPASFRHPSRRPRGAR